MNWVQRKIYLYNVTFGLFMLDWWERYLFNILVIVLMFFIFYNGSRYVTEFCKRSERDYYTSQSVRERGTEIHHQDLYQASRVNLRYQMQQ